MEMEDPASLDKHIGYYDEDGYCVWQGKLEIEDGMINLSYDASDAIANEHRRAHEAAQQAAHEAYLQTDEGKARNQEVEEARRQGLLP